MLWLLACTVVVVVALWSWLMRSLAHTRSRLHRRGCHTKGARLSRRGSIA